MSVASCIRRGQLERPRTNIWKRLPSALCLLLLLPIVAAGQPSLEQQRSDFLAAERALTNGDRARFQALRKSLLSYPLYPYLEFALLQSELDSVDSSRVEDFLTSYANTPLAWRMRHQWLKKLAVRQKWWTYEVFYRPNMGTTLKCHHLTALLETGKQELALHEAEQIWLHERSQPKACDTILDSWIKAGRLTEALAWQRVELAMHASRSRFANYLRRFLNERQKGWLDHWRTLQRQPQKLVQLQSKLTDSPSHHSIVLDVFTRLSRRDGEAALKTWDKLQSVIAFDESQLYTAERALLLGLIESDHPQLIPRLTRFQPRSDDESFLERRLRVALQKRNWPQLLAWSEALPATLRNSDRWRYWRARALTETGQREQAQQLFSELATARSYHGFLAADRLDQPYRYDADALQPPQESIELLANKPGLLRARELFQLGRYIDARREWRQSVNRLNRQELKHVSKLAQSWGWHDRAIFTLARTGYWDDLVLRFPLEHQVLVEEHSVDTGLDSSWIFAVIRQESAFSRDAHSPAGAMGLMQLMPATARFIARKQKLKTPRRQELLRPDLNIKLGTAYLSHVYQRLGNNPVLATAAYNAGPNKVMKWLPRESVPADIWVELIPYRETRRYTERVLSYAAIYDQRMRLPLQRLVDRMPTIQPRSQLAIRSVSEKNAAL